MRSSTTHYLAVHDATSAQPAFLLNQFGLRFDEVSASNLLKIRLDGTVVDAGSNAGASRQPRRLRHPRCDSRCATRPQMRLALALHSRDGDGEHARARHAAAITGGMHRAARASSTQHAFEGVATDLDEQARLVASLGSSEVLLMANHGVLCGGGSVAAAFYNAHLVSRAADHQMEMMRAVGGQLEALYVPSERIVQTTADRLALQTAAAGGQEWGRWEWQAVMRQICGAVGRSADRQAPR